ncbi:GNAT family N-acetyltransferase [Chryseobacterium sp.]|uniref:GNAT family N-acetyltransferase n=1 Tax=Chryseobacterium sp. TaxID=1871047 RepID=UPI0025BCA1C2|nr:GNAT family N-acetyltransferase [Chryseobacterium sp.]MBV8328579.1 GNAT family N-acetyltransferase [Chryseobacterium sp.]
MDPDLHYRKADETDIDFLLNLRMKTMNPHYAESKLPTDQKTTLQRVLYEFDKANIIFLHHQPIGLLKINQTDEKTEVLQLQIDPELQGRGLGRKILTAILDKAGATGRTVSLSVLKTNKAQHLYSSLGFKIISEDEHSYFMEISPV